ncbi:MAG: carboxylesterase family protein [Oceanicaulis sp.]
MKLRIWFIAAFVTCLAQSACAPEAGAPQDAAPGGGGEVGEAESGANAPAAVTPTAATPAALIRAGAVTGLALDGLPDGGAFRGVPFAAPPVGDRRWRAPAPVSPASEPLDATRFAPACMQTSAITDWYANIAESVGASPDVAPAPNGVSEDCLYLNIWTPDLEPDALAPVMVYIHGGSYTSGWSYEPNYHGEAFAARGVVLVSIAYRLGALGYLAPDAPGATANAGLLDQIAALEWVRDNIEVFGGDPDRVTIFGESAGAAAVGALMTAPPARGLFHRAISQSGGFELAAERTRESADSAFQRLADALAGDPMAAPASEILAAAGEALPGYDYGPVSGVAGLPRSPREAVARGEVAATPLMIGVNRDEWLMYLDREAQDGDLDVWRERIGGRAVDRLLADAGSVRAALDRLETAALMRCPGRALAAAVVQAGAPVFLYRLDRVRDGAEALGAYHGAELPYVFDSHDAWLPTALEDEALGRAMNAAWARFAATGDPNGASGPGWPEYAASGELLIWDLEPRIGAPLDDDLCAPLGWGAP